MDILKLIIFREKAIWKLMMFQGIRDGFLEGDFQCLSISITVTEIETS